MMSERLWIKIGNFWIVLLQGFVRFDIKWNSGIFGEDSLNFFLSLKKKIKEHLDYLLKETRFNAKDIPKCLNIFSKNLDDLKARFDELSQIGAPITIQALTKTKTEYLKYAKTFCNEENDEHKTILLAIEKRLKSSRRKIPNN